MKHGRKWNNGAVCQEVSVSASLHIAWIRAWIVRRNLVFARRLNLSPYYDCILMQVEEGFKHPRPDGCPREIYEAIVLPSLEYEPKARSRFKKIVQTLKELEDNAYEKPVPVAHDTAAYDKLWPK